jgi:hypothetical protein
MEMLAKSTGLYAAVRMGVCGEWVDHTSVSCDAEITRMQTEEWDRRNRGYAYSKPVVRIARVEIREVES